MLATQRVDRPEISLHQLEWTRFESEQLHTMSVELPREPLKAKCTSAFLSAIIDRRRNDDDVIHVEIRDCSYRCIPGQPVLFSPVELRPAARKTLQLGAHVFAARDICNRGTQEVGRPLHAGCSVGLVSPGIQHE
ncbi:hypothetical protein CQ034_08595 [Microbacterium sp. MYb45]|nr:hypothetical protein CQ034_08595 [Microbacterium sp. MYb45]